MIAKRRYSSDNTEMPICRPTKEAANSTGGNWEVDSQHRDVYLTSQLTRINKNQVLLIIVCLEPARKLISDVLRVEILKRHTGVIGIAPKAGMSIPIDTCCIWCTVGGWVIESLVERLLCVNEFKARIGVRRLEVVNMSLE